MRSSQRNFDIIQKKKEGATLAMLAKEYHLSRERIRLICNNDNFCKYPYQELIKLGATSKTALNVCKIFENANVKSRDDLEKLSLSQIETLPGASYRSQAMVYIAILYNLVKNDLK